MKFTAALLSSVLFATTAFAGLAERRAARARLRKTNPASVVGTPAVDGVLAKNSTNVQYSSNWAGAVLTSPPTGSTFNAVSAQFTVPSATGTGAASAWVGIDGDTYSAAILQTGVDFNVQGGRTTYDCWYEWYPDYAYDFSGIPIAAGNVISISVVASSTRAGKVVISNLSTGKTVTKSLTAPSTNSPLGGMNAEWIVEDFEQGGSLVDFANFGTVVFTNATAYTSSGATVTPAGADILDIKQNNRVLTSVSVSGSTVTVSHT